VTNTRVLCICVDSAEKTLLLDWAARGELPYLQSLLDRAAYTTTQLGESGFYTGPVWPSFYTGTSLDQHGKFAERQLVAGSYEVRKFPLDAIKATPFWRLLGGSGHRTAIIDFGKTVVDRNINGIHIVGWGAHDADYYDPMRYAEQKMQVSPPEWEIEITERWQAPLFGDSDVEIGDRSAAAIQRFQDLLIARIEAKTQMSLDLLQREPWSLFAVNFAEAHSVGHQCWHLTDETAPTYDRELRQRIGDPVLKVYQAIDNAVGKLVETAGPDNHVAFFSTLGMGPHISGQPAMDPLLRRLDGGDRARAWLYRWLRATWNRIPRSMRYRFRPMQEASRNRLLGPERSARRFFALHSNSDYGSIRINLSGREPNGMVEPGEEFDRVCDELANAFSALRNAETGESAVERVMRSDTLYRRRGDDSLPDLLVEWRKTSPIRVLESPRIGRLHVINDETRTGDHRPHGLFALAGHGIRPGELQRPLSVLELAPTLCALLGAHYDDFELAPAPELLPAESEFKGSSNCE